MISYYDASNENLKVAHCIDASCTSANLTTLATSGPVGRYTSATVGADGLGLISYQGNGELRVAHCKDVVCTNANLSLVDNVISANTSVTIGPDGRPLVSYLGVFAGDLKVAHCSNSFCAPYLRRR